ncbi:MAG: dephospho-CoA kinase [Chloroflexi bacterium]|nr:MAG: dephospho-CoA kinase [Chloroflexota bacterium]TMG30386.1 MAG: dephospho-CoA kinase [Chloroflexota bacterium]
MRVLGLTGGIGSGKTMVGAMFTELGAELIDADQMAREVVEPGQPALDEIVTSFGRDILLPDGRLDRRTLAAIVFADASARARLNAITHPRIRERMDAAIAARRDRAGVLIVDIPLLFENLRTGVVEKVIVVWVDPQTQMRRLIERGGLTEEEAHQRIAAQMPLDEKRRLADHVIDNRGTPAETRRQVEAILRHYASED